MRDAGAYRATFQKLLHAVLLIVLLLEVIMLLRFRAILSGILTCCVAAIPRVLSVPTLLEKKKEALYIHARAETQLSARQRLASGYCW